MFEKILASSKNSENVSLTIKGLLMNLVAVVIFVGGSAVDTVVLNSAVDAIASVVATVVLLVGQVQVAWGLIRKLNPKNWL